VIAFVAGFLSVVEAGESEPAVVSARQDETFRLDGEKVFADGEEVFADGEEGLSGRVSGGTLVERDGLILRSLTANERATLLPSVVNDRRHEGGGATIADFQVLQVSFTIGDCVGNCTGRPCNEVLLLWVEPEPKLEQINIFLDQVSIGTIDPLPPQAVPGVHAVIFSGIRAGDYTFAIESPGNGIRLEQKFSVIDEQPFADPTESTCEEILAPMVGCSLMVRWKNGSPAPTRYGVFLDGEFRATIPGDSEEFLFENVGPGERRVQISGITEIDSGDRYRGCPLHFTCAIDCNFSNCDPPAGLLLCQTGFRPGEHEVQARWTNTEAKYVGGIHGFVNGQRVGTLSGTLESGFFQPLLDTENRIGVQGDCGAGNVSAIVEATIDLLPESPHVRPVRGEVLCGHNSDISQSWAQWIPEDPSIGVSVHLRRAAQLFFVGTILEPVNRVTVSPTLPDDRLVLQFLARVGKHCYGSPRIECVEPPPPPNAFLPGACNGQGVVDISSAVFILNFLFLDGGTPLCLIACDCNGDLGLDLSDALCVLNFLFLNGPPPARWENGEPTCVQVTPVMNCERGNAICAQ